MEVGPTYVAGLRASVGLNDLEVRTFGQVAESVRTTLTSARSAAVAVVSPPYAFHTSSLLLETSAVGRQSVAAIAGVAKVTWSM